MKTTESIIKEIRDTFGLYLYNDQEAMDIAMKRLEEFIKEALERVREETIEEVHTILRDYCVRISDDCRCHEVFEKINKLKTNKPHTKKCDELRKGLEDGMGVTFGDTCYCDTIANKSPKLSCGCPKQDKFAMCINQEHCKEG